MPQARNSTAFQRFLDTPELLDMVLVFVNDKGALAALTRTSQVFKEAALNALWSEVDSLEPLLLLLSPLVQIKPGIWDFVEPRITLQKWENYAKYSTRVKVIKDLFDDKTDSFAPSIFTAIGQTRSDHMPLLPNLRSVRIKITKERVMPCIPFFSKSLLNLTLWSQLDPSDRQFVHQEILARAPMLQTLAIETAFVSDTGREALLKLLLGCQNLKEIVLPGRNLTTATLMALSHIQSLQTIKTSHLYRAKGALDFRPIPTIPFRSLVHLRLSLPLEAIIPIMVEDNWAPQLTKLEIESRYTAKHHLEAFNVALARSVPNITTLVLDLFDSSLDHRQRSPGLEFQALKPLLECRQISTFFIRHQLYIPLRFEDLECILVKWPKLVSFYFCLDAQETGVGSTDFGFSLKVLRLFARLCPQIETLGLCFRSYETDAWSPGLQLRALKQLHYGPPASQAPLDFAVFLAYICRDSLVFGVGRYCYETGSPGASAYHMSAERDVLWFLFRLSSTMRQEAAAEATKESRELRQQLVERDARLAEQVLWLTEKESSITEKDARLEENDIRLTELQRELESERNRVRELEQALRGQTSPASRRRSTRKAKEEDGN